MIIFRFLRCFLEVANWEKVDRKEVATLGAIVFSFGLLFPLIVLLQSYPPFTEFRTSIAQVASRMGWTGNRHLPELIVGVAIFSPLAYGLFFTSRARLAQEAFDAKYAKHLLRNIGHTKTPVAATLFIVTALQMFVAGYYRETSAVLCALSLLAMNKLLEKYLRKIDLDGNN